MSHTVTIIITMILFAMVSAALYVWGLKKSINQKENLSIRLYNKCASRVVKYLKKNGSITEKEMERLIANIKTGEVYSRNKAVVNNPRSFVSGLIDFMVDRKLIVRHRDGFRLLKEV